MHSIVFISAYSWWHHQMETFSASLAICAGNSPVPGEFPAQRPVSRSFDDSFDLRLDKLLSKQSWGWRFEMLSCPLWRHCNGRHLTGCKWSCHFDNFRCSHRRNLGQNDNMRHVCYMYTETNSSFFMKFRQNDNVISFQGRKAYLRHFHL